MKILLLCTDDNCRTLMARGWLHYFDRSLFIRSAGTHLKGSPNQYAQQVMQETGIDIAHWIPEKVDKYLAEDWDYVIFLCRESFDTRSDFIGKVRNYLPIYFDNPMPVETLFNNPIQNSVYIRFVKLRDQMKARLFDFYLKEIHGKEMLGADSCGAECDL